MRRKRSKIRKKPNSVLSSKEANEIKKLYSYLMKKTKAKNLLIESEEIFTKEKDYFGVGDPMSDEVPKIMTR